jgi:hypothetical protein
MQLTRWESHGRGIANNNLHTIQFQMGRARLAARGTVLKSTALARPEARSIVLSAGTTRRSFSAWAATLARQAGPKHGPIGAARKRPDLRHESGPAC